MFLYKLIWSKTAYNKMYHFKIIFDSFGMWPFDSESIYPTYTEASTHLYPIDLKVFIGSRYRSQDVALVLVRLMQPFVPCTNKIWCFFYTHMGGHYGLQNKHPSGFKMYTIYLIPPQMKMRCQQYGAVNTPKIRLWVYTSTPSCVENEP